MTEEEIKALAKQLGLDPERLVIMEPRSMLWWDGATHRVYNLIYHGENSQRDFNFVLSAADIENGLETVGVEFYVNKGLRELSQAENKKDETT